jgi:23S rRNA (adenine-N6)-dimethyltransferase
VVAHQPWGWHQLKRRWAEELVDRAGVGPGDIVLDVGAGTGAVTAPLLATGARVIAIELHPGRAAHLRDRFGSRLVVVQCDAGDLRLPRRPFHVVASIPFSVTTPLLRRLLHQGSRLVSARLIVQDQAARRWSSQAAPAAARWQAAFVVEADGRVPRHAFVPPPRVDGRTLVISRVR